MKDETIEKSTQEQINEKQQLLNDYKNGKRKRPESKTEYLQVLSDLESEIEQLNEKYDIENTPSEWDNIRMTRNMFLFESDWTQIPDNPKSKDKEWLKYRQLLRDIPQTFALAEDVVFPEKPKE